MWTTLSFTLFLLSMASPTASNILADRSIFTGGDVLAHNICDASMTSCNWETGNSWCCPLSTVCDGIGGGGYCCPTCKPFHFPPFDLSFTFTYYKPLAVLKYWQRTTAGQRLMLIPAVLIPPGPSGWVQVQAHITLTVMGSCRNTFAAWEMSLG
jgi:hypothetical protein